MSAPKEAVFKGYAVHDSKKWKEFKVIDFESKTLADEDVEIAIHYCGVCGSDVHTISGGWGDIITPMITGHEIAGVVTKVGKDVKEFKAGDRVGVGAQVWSCGKCDRCKSDNENYCPDQVDTYNAKYPSGEISHGGYSTGIRASHRFVFKIPDQIALEQAASMLCGGLTTYSPLVRNGCGPGKRVGVVGIGGLGHYAIQWAKALGAKEVVAISHSPSKKEDAMKMGADKFVATEGTKGGLKDSVSDLDIIINTTDLAKAIPLSDCLGALTVHGVLVSVGLPNEPFPETKAFDFAANGSRFMVTHIGSKKECNAMLKLAVEKGVKTWTVPMAMKDCSKAVAALKEGGDSSVRYRQVLKQDLFDYGNVN